MIQLNTIKEAEEFINKSETIYFQNKVFWSRKNLLEFIKDIKSGKELKTPKHAINFIFETNFGDVFCNKLIVSEKNLYFFNNDKLILEKTRKKTDDIAYFFYNPKNETFCSGNPIIYDYEQDQQYIDLNRIDNHWG